MGYGSKEVKGGSWMSKHSLANSRFIKDMPIEHDMHRDGPKNYDTDKGSHSHPHDGPKKQGYNARLDESLGMSNGKESTKSQSYKSRRDESKGMEKSLGHPAYSGNKSSSQVGYPDTKNRG